MTDFILGSGLIGLLARKLLGSEWVMVPFGRSRIYSFCPALCDDFIIRDSRIDDFMASFGAKPTLFSRVMYSCGGELLPPSSEMVQMWLDRVYDNPATHLQLIENNRSAYTVYNKAASYIYDQLLREYINPLKEAAQKGPLVKITPHQLHYEHQTVEYKSLISTIPLPALLKLTGHELPLQAKPAWLYHIACEKIDLGPATQVRVIDEFAFYKCNKLDPGQYVFFCLEELENPVSYFEQFFTDFKILNSTRINDYIQEGERVDLSILKPYDITCLGSYAEWDAGLDIGSCIIRLLTAETKLS